MAERKKSKFFPSYTYTLAFELDVLYATFEVIFVHFSFRMGELFTCLSVVIVICCICTVFGVPIFQIITKYIVHITGADR